MGKAAALAVAGLAAGVMPLLLLANAASFVGAAAFIAAVVLEFAAIRVAMRQRMPRPEAAPVADG